jgi:ABC-type glycerol-3-phosphate transport system substrate-binding protein
MKSNFQTILIAVFLAFFVFAVLIFSGLIKVDDNSSDGTTTALTGKVTIWGTFSNSNLAHAFDAINEANRDLAISYVRKDASTYQQSLIEAFASGTGPDLFFITSDMVMKNEGFVYKIPFASYPQKTFTDAFIEGSSVYVGTDGIIGFPVVVDPMVLYYNKDMFTNAGIALPPKYWDELFDENSKLTKSKNDGTILESMIALGRFDNINHAKDIIASLFAQNGNSIVSRTETGYTPTLDGISTSSRVRPEAVLNFFVEFSNPSNGGYSWNSALPNSRDMFTGGKMAMYLGRASELFTIQSTNPNLSFDVTEILQTRNMNTKRTEGDIYALAINKSSKNLSSAFGLAGTLATGDNAKGFATSLSLPPALKTILATKPENPYMQTFFNSALFTRSWLDPESKATDAVFDELVRNILSNKLSTTDALAKAQNQLELLITKK